MTVELPHTFSRRELQECVDYDIPEATKVMFKIGISPKLLLLFMEFCSQQGETVELVTATESILSQSASRADVAANLRFFKRDRVEEDADDV